MYLFRNIYILLIIGCFGCKTPPQQDTVKVSTHTVTVRNAGLVQIHVIETKSDTIP